MPPGLIWVTGAWGILRSPLGYTRSRTSFPNQTHIREHIGKNNHKNRTIYGKAKFLWVEKNGESRLSLNLFAASCYIFVTERFQISFWQCLAEQVFPKTYLSSLNFPPFLNININTWMKNTKSVPESFRNSNMG